MLPGFLNDISHVVQKISGIFYMTPIMIEHYEISSPVQNVYKCFDIDKHYAYLNSNLQVSLSAKTLGSSLIYPLLKAKLLLEE